LLLTTVALSFTILSRTVGRATLLLAIGLSALLLMVAAAIHSPLLALLTLTIGCTTLLLLAVVVGFLLAVALLLAVPLLAVPLLTVTLLLAVALVIVWTRHGEDRDEFKVWRENRCLVKRKRR
jgi:hypothetical protein